MKSEYKISSNIILNLDEGFFIQNSGQRIAITAYQERFLKYLILNKNRPCINNNIKAFVYRGETIPKETPDFYSQLLKICPALRERISIQKYELMDIGYRFKLPKTKEFAEFWPDLAPEELSEKSELDIADIGASLKKVQKHLSTEQKTILRILMLHHNKPLTYQTIIKLSHSILGDGEHPLQNTYEIIKACNELMESIPETKLLLESVYLNTIAYVYKPYPAEQNTEEYILQTPYSDAVEKKQNISSKNTIIPYPSPEALDENFYHVTGNIYISAINRVAITYLDKNLVSCTSLTPKISTLLNILIQNMGCTVTKELLAEKLYGEDYYALDNNQIDNRLYELVKRLKDLVPEITGCLKQDRGIGYGIQFTDYNV